MKYFISNDLGCVYRLKNNQLEYAPMRIDHTFHTTEFNLVEPDMVGEEQVTFKGEETNLYSVFKTVTEVLRSYIKDGKLA